MNYSIIVYILGWILNFQAAFMVLPCAVAILYQEQAGWSFLSSIMICIIIGIPLVIRKPKNQVFYAAEGFVTTAFSWIVLSITGALPFLISGAIVSPVDAIFETVSGFTTTGASILTDVEVLPKSILFWRSFTHWIGGMGVLVFILTLLPLTGGYHMNLMKAESPGPSVSRLVPRVQSTAKILYGIYIGMTIVEIALLLLGRMSLFDSLTISFGTAGTGGFGIKNDSMAGYSPYLQNVVTIFMILFGVNFNVYFLLLCGRIWQGLKCEELKCYLGIIAGSILLITLNTQSSHKSFGDAFHHAAFQVASIITTTGYATENFDLWPQASKTILVMLMFVGACAGSTGGGIKVSRVLILAKTVKKEIQQFLHPRAIGKVKMDGKVVEHETVRCINVFLAAYMLIFAGSVLLLAFDNRDFVTNFTAVAATFNNIGPGLGLVGPSQNFSLFSGWVKVVLIFDMLAGRLELFPLLLLFAKDTWKKF